MTRVQLSLRARGLKNKASGKNISDPFAVVTLLAPQSSPQSSGGAPQVLGRTETIYDDLSPDWIKTFTFNYDLGLQQYFVVTIYDEKEKHKNSDNLGKHKEIAQSKFELGSILGSPGNINAKSVSSGGIVYASVEESAFDARKLLLAVRGRKLANVENTLFGKSDPFFEIYAKKHSPHGDSWDAVYRSEYIRSNLSPEWKAASVSIETLCGSDLDRPIKISVFDFSKKGIFTPMGSCETTVNDLVNRSNTKQPSNFKMLEGKLVIDKAWMIGDSGDAGLAGKVSNLKMSEAAPVFSTSSAPPRVASAKKPSFVDYLSGGCELNLAVAIDFTGSNGDPRRPGTLHHMNPSSSNSYQKVITAIGSILEKYDSDHRFPVMGFGAKYGGVIQHCFQCGPTPEVVGVNGIMDAYNSVFKTPLTMSGPTVFTKVIQVSAAHAIQAQRAANQVGKQVYSVLLILTDGAVSDVMATKQAIGEVCNAPLSIVIVGIGNADFSAMQYLDDNSVGRDIVQFVESQRHLHSKGSLTAATLDEIPRQLVQYFSMNGILPGSKVVLREEDIAVSSDEEEIDLGLSINAEGEIAVNGGGYYSDGYDMPAVSYPPVSSQPHTPGAPTQPFTPGVPPQPYMPGPSSQPYTPGAPSQPYTPGMPSLPASGVPSQPYAPVASSQPYAPGGPSQPYAPGAPTHPNVPGAPPQPYVSGAPSQPYVPGAPSQPYVPGAPSQACTPQPSCAPGEPPSALPPAYGPGAYVPQYP